MDWWERRQSTSLRPVSVSFQSESLDSNHYSSELDQRTASNRTINNFPEQPKACLHEALLRFGPARSCWWHARCRVVQRVRSFSSLWKFDELELYLPLQPISPLPGLIGFGVDEHFVGGYAECPSQILQARQHDSSLFCYSPRCS